MVLVPGVRNEVALDGEFLFRVQGSYTMDVSITQPRNASRGIHCPGLIEPMTLSPPDAFLKPFL